MEQWEAVPRQPRVGRWGAVYVTLNREGVIALSKLTFEQMGAPKAVRLLFDKINSRIGLQPTTLTGRDAYPLATHGRHGGKKVRAWQMMQIYKIDLPDTVRFYDASIDQDGILVLDLRTAKVSKQAISRRNAWEVQRRENTGAKKSF